MYECWAAYYDLQVQMEIQIDLHDAKEDPLTSCVSFQIIFKNTLNIIIYILK